MRGGGKSTVQQVHENVLRRFKELVLVACLHKHLFGENVLHQLPGLRRDIFQVPVRIYADEAAKAHACADERRKTPPVGAIRQLDIVRPTGCEHRIFADDRAGLIGDLAAAHGGFKERIGKAERQVVRRDVEGVVQHQKRAARSSPVLTVSFPRSSCAKNCSSSVSALHISHVASPMRYIPPILCFRHNKFFLYCTDSFLFLQEERINCTAEREKKDGKRKKMHRCMEYRAQNECICCRGFDRRKCLTLVRSEHAAALPASF